MEEDTKKHDAFFTYLEKDEFFIVTCIDSKQRKLIHQYIESNYPNTNNIGMCIDTFKKTTRRFLKCIECSNKSVPILTEKYCYGYSENNEDEYYHVECKKCERRWSWEPNYDGYDDVRSFDENNCILVGNYMKLKYNPHKNTIQKKITADDVKDIVGKCQIQLIKRPEKILKNQDLQKFVNDEMSK
jgi:hypothetical protein